MFCWKKGVSAVTYSPMTCMMGPVMALTAPDASRGPRGYVVPLSAMNSYEATVVSMMSNSMLGKQRCRTRQRTSFTTPIYSKMGS